MALGAAIAVARTDPPPMRQCDLNTDLPITSLVPKGRQRVAGHLSVLGYPREGFAEMVNQIGALWMSHAAQSVFRLRVPVFYPLASIATPVAWSHSHFANAQRARTPRVASRPFDALGGAQ